MTPSRPFIKTFFSCLTVIMLLWAPQALCLEVPNYQGYVNDYGDMISPGMEKKLEKALQSFDLSDSTQIAILTIPSLENEVIEDFSIKVVDKWQVGQKDKDNGVLLLAAKKERKIRIEVGRGLEPTLTDLLSGRIIDGIITPYFKAGEFDQGFAAGAEAIAKAVRGEFKNDLPRRRSRRSGEPSPLFKFLFFAIIAATFVGYNSRKHGAIAGAAIFPIAFLLGLLPPSSLLLLLLLIPGGALAAGWLLPIVFAGVFSNMTTHHRGGYYGGFGRGGFGGGGGFRGGGFGGFGGGGFGGGGASGGW